MKKEKLDRLLVMRGLFASGEKARRAVMAGSVLVDGRLEDKPGKAVAVDCNLEIAKRRKYVGRGGEKLETAIKEFGISVSGRKCLDIGASTGGFTDCLLQSGAAEVIAVDVGYGQLAPKLRDAPRVRNLERTNARYLKREDLPYAPDLVTIDVSFISIEKIIPAVKSLVGRGADVVVLVKPQFEAERKEVQRGGVVRNGRVHARVMSRVRESCEENGFIIRGEMESPLRGPAGNREFFIHLIKQ